MNAPLIFWVCLKHNCYVTLHFTVLFLLKCQGVEEAKLEGSIPECLLKKTVSLVEAESPEMDTTLTGEKSIHSSPYVQSSDSFLNLFSLHFSALFFVTDPQF